MNFRIDFSIMPKPVRKLRFQQIQELAISKGIIWTSRRTIPHHYDKLVEAIAHNRMFIITGYPDMAFTGLDEGDLISYRDAIKQLKEYVNEKRTID